MNLDTVDYYALSPLLLLLGGALLILLIETFSPVKKVPFYVSILTLLGAFVLVLKAPASENALLTPWIRFDGLAHFFSLFFITVGLASCLLSSPFFKRFPRDEAEYYFLLMSALIGLILIGISADFLTLFIGLETLSISLYVLCGYMKDWEISHESAIKYFLLGSLGAAFLLYGIALVYGATGSTNFSHLLPSYQSLNGMSGKSLFFAGIALVTVGLAFKAAIFPFHVWAPDVYEGSPTPITAFMAVGTKAGALAAFAIIFLKTLPNFDTLWNEGMMILAIPTLIYANFVAMTQTEMRRFFAYSGISHAGFLLLPLISGGPDALLALLFYLVVYGVATFGAFACLSCINDREQGIFLTDLKGLFRRKPLTGALLALCLLTLGGIPPTAGFFSKFFIFKVAFQAGYYSLVIIGLLVTILSAYYYLRIIGVMLAEAPDKEEIPKRSRSLIILEVLGLAALLFLSCYPTPLLTWMGKLTN